MDHGSSDTISRRPLLTRDPHYPRYHFLPPANWMNDPNGLIQWNGVYHLFYQYNPNGPFHGTIHWGHAATRDLVHWADLPIALTPTPGGPDADGCWSGSAVDDGGVPTLIYTGVHPQSQCLAVSHDDLRTWEKLLMPVIPAPPADLDLDGFRDPYVWRDGDRWLGVVGTGIKEAGGAVLLYESTDLRHWTYRQPICTGDPEVNGLIWECPNLFPIGDRWLLLLSPIPLRRSIYMLGRFDGEAFRSESQTDFDAGGCLYAPQAMRDESGRRLVWGWLWEGRPASACETAGWNGVMSLPRLLDLKANGSLRIAPAPEVAALRGAHRRYANIPLSGYVTIEGLAGDALEIIADFAVDAAGRVGLAVRRTPDGEEQTLVVYDAVARRLSIDRSRSSLDSDVESDVRSAELDVPDGRLSLHLFLDRSVLEVFANEHVTLTSRIYPTLSAALGVVALGAEPSSLRSLDAWEMQSIWT